MPRVKCTTNARRRCRYCSGKVFYALQQTRRAKRVIDVAMVRVEQLLPFPHEALARRLGRYPAGWAAQELNSIVPMRLKVVQF